MGRRGHQRKDRRETKDVKGLFITFEGPDGAGKSTHSRRLAAWLRRRGKRVLLTREPGGTPIGTQIRRILLHSKPGSMDARTELLLYEASRSLIVSQVIRPALKAGRVVILDRFQDSTWVYQGWAGGMDLKLVEQLGEAATGGLEPRRTILLDLPARKGLARVRRPNRMEKKPAAFHENVSGWCGRTARSRRSSRRCGRRCAMSFEPIVGLEPAVRLLKGQIVKERLANTYLLTGPEGIGKRTLALELARALGSTDHDVAVVAPLEDKSEIGIDQVRELEAKLSLTPHSSQWKVGIIDEAHALTEEGMHGCLKLLEEPPPRSVVVLVTSAPHRLFATVVSRAHVVRCSPQGIEKVTAALQERAGLPADQARRLAVSAGGRMGMALELQEGKRLAARNAALDQMLAARSRGQIEIPLAKVSREEVRENIEWYAGWWRD
ncbi:MAG: dTMP kinase, partial [Candidatus Omnitrophica bacterium]|nr:dTMP kinase [Candidatus Omnitrophota bacterium]